MLRSFFCYVFVLMSALCVTPARCALPDLTQDIRCLVASIDLLQMGPSSDARNAALSSVLYYLGRLDGQNSTLDLESLIVAESQKMTQNDIRLELQRCGKVLSERGSVITTIGQRLTKSSTTASPK